ncbi:MAG: hypothetical protein V3V20_07010 [Algisphaera sp.]
MRKESLAEVLRNPFTKAMTEFLSTKSEKALAADKEIKKLEITRDSLSADSPARVGIEQAIESLNAGDDELARERREEAAFAVIMLCNELRLPVQLKTKAPKPLKAVVVSGQPVVRGKRRRLDKRAREEAEKALLKVLKGGKPFTRSEIIERTGMDGPMYTAVTRILKNEGDIVTVGRGRASLLQLS